MKDLKFCIEKKDAAVLLEALRCVLVPGNLCCYEIEPVVKGIGEHI